jgi:hypothetical protein
MQPRGAGGPRYFDRLVWELPIPEYDRREGLHQELAVAAAEAELVVAQVLADDASWWLARCFYRMAQSFTVPSWGEVERVLQLVVCEVPNHPNLQCMFTESFMGCGNNKKNG